MGNRRIRPLCLVILTVFLILVSSASQFTHPVDAATTTSTQTDNSGITPQWLSQQTQLWKPTVNTSLNFQVLFDRASYGDLEYPFNDMTVQLADLNMIVSTGAKCVRVDVNYAPWLQDNQTAINMLTTLIQKIKADGECLVIADAASETYRNGGQIPWAQFQAEWIQRDKTLAELYHPDYFLVVKEPGWYVALVSDARTNPTFQSPSSWINLTQTLAATVLSVSPNTKVGVSVAADSLSAQPAFYSAFLTGVEKLSNVSIIGYDIYDVLGFTNTQNFLDKYGNGGKSVWIAEAWSGDGSFIYDSSRAQLDQQWILALYYFAEHIHASAVMPFFTDLFASYSLTDSSPTNSAQIIALYNQRTPVYSEFKAIISASPTTTTSSLTSSSSVTSSSSTTSTSSFATSTTTFTSSSTSATVTSPGGRPHISFGLVVAVIVLIVLALSLVYMFVRKKRT